MQLQVKIYTKGAEKHLLCQSAIRYDKTPKTKEDKTTIWGRNIFRNRITIKWTVVKKLGLNYTHISQSRMEELHFFFHESADRFGPRRGCGCAYCEAAGRWLENKAGTFCTESAWSTCWNALWFESLVLLISEAATSVWLTGLLVKFSGWLRLSDWTREVIEKALDCDANPRDPAPAVPELVKAWYSGGADNCCEPSNPPPISLWMRLSSSLKIK